MKNIIFIAPPASGKGTQSELLVDRFKYTHISTGDLLREIIENNDPLAEEVKNIITSGKLVSDDLITRLLESKISSLKGKPFVLDGFPRTINQAYALQEMFVKNDLNNYKVIYLEIDKELALKRVLGRAICSCGKTYNLDDENYKPKCEGICDVCGKKLMRRLDDSESKFLIRYETYITSTKPVIDYYRNKGILKTIDASIGAEKVFEKLEEIISDKN